MTYITSYNRGPYYSDDPVEPPKRSKNPFSLLNKFFKSREPDPLSNIYRTGVVVSLVMVLFVVGVIGASVLY